MKRKKIPGIGWLLELKPAIGLARVSLHKEVSRRGEYWEDPSLPISEEAEEVREKVSQAARGILQKYRGLVTSVEIYPWKTPWPVDEVVEC